MDAGSSPQGWIEREGRHELWHQRRCIATIHADGRVVIDARLAWQVVTGRTRSAAVGRRQVEAWMRAHKCGPWEA